MTEHRESAEIDAIIEYRSKTQDAPWLSWSDVTAEWLPLRPSTWWLPQGTVLLSQMLKAAADSVTTIPGLVEMTVESRYGATIEQYRVRRSAGREEGQ